MNEKKLIKRCLSEEEIRVLTNFSMNSKLSDRAITILRKNKQHRIKNVKCKIQEHIDEKLLVIN